MTSVMKLSFDKGRFNAWEEYLADYSWKRGAFWCAIWPIMLR